MFARWLTYLSFACFGALSLMVLQMTKRPLCIDSRVVEKVDRLAAAGTDTVYRCALNKETAYSEYFGRSVRELSTRIGSIEKVLESIEPFSKKMQITIMDEIPYMYRVQGHHLFIGKELLQAPGHLEKALAKVWFEEREASDFAQEKLLEEVVTDFLVYLNFGDLDLGDPETRLTTAKIGRAHV